MEQENKLQPYTDSGNRAGRPKLTMEAQERAIGVLANPAALRRMGSATPLLAIVNERCGDDDNCRIKYREEAKTLGVSVATLKTWADALERLGYFTRALHGPSGVEIRLCPEMWHQGDGTLLADRLKQVAGVVYALQITMNGALNSAACELQRMHGEAA